MDNPTTCANNVHLASSKYEAVGGLVGAVDPFLHQLGEVEGGFCIIAQLCGGDHAAGKAHIVVGDVALRPALAVV